MSDGLKVGDTVIVNSFYRPKWGVIVDHHWDEGDVWTVNADGMKIECCTNELEKRDMK